MTRKLAAAALFAALLGGARPAAGEIATGFDVQNWKPALDPYGYATVNGAKSLDFKQLHVAVWCDWAKNALEFQPNIPVAGGRAVVRNLTMLDLTASVGILSLGRSGGIQVGVDAPVVLEEDGLRVDERDRGQRFRDQSFGQLRTEAKITLFDRDSDGFPLGLAIRPFAEWATAQEIDLLSNNGRNSFGATLIVEKRLGAFRVAAEVGYQWIDGTIVVAGTTVDDKLRASLGIAYDLTEHWTLYGEVYHWARIGNPYKKETEAPSETDCGIKYTGLFFFVLGAGGGNNDGVGSPDGRLYGSIGITF